MTDTKPFAPFVPEKKVEAIITVLEADLIRRLRQYPYGQFVVHKQNGVLIRIEVRDSQLLDGSTVIDLS